MDKFFSEVYKAIKDDELKIVYQPQINIKTKKVIGLESLIRFTDSNNQIADTESFITKLELLGAVYLVDYYMIEKAFKMVEDMRINGNIMIPITVNISKSTFLRYDFLDQVKRLLKEYDVSSKYIEFELTEREIFQDIEELYKSINYIRQLGIKISIDDFGVGFSSLLAISYLNFDTLKIDKSIINKIGKNSKIDSILNGIKKSMDENNIETIAEGVESEEQYLKLLEQGYEYAQGYFFSKPKCIEEIKKYMCKVNMSVSC